MTKSPKADSPHKPNPGSFPSPDAQAQKKKRTPLWQGILLPLAAILVFFLLLEGGLALFGIKPALQTEDPFVGFSSNVPLFVPAPGPGNRQQLVTAENKLSFFNAQSFPREKPKGTFRIFCLGGSTTYGRPYDDKTSFSSWLRELLPAADGHQRWEVINAGGISYASYRVAHLMEELVDYQPDLFIVYTGHNEFLEDRTYKKLRQLPAVVRSAASLLAGTRTWSAMGSALKGLGIQTVTKKKDRDQLGGEVNAILDRTIGPERYSRDDALRANIVKHYRISLERMVTLARSVDAKIIFVTPASNLKDCTPFKSEHTQGLDPVAVQRSEQLLSEAEEAIRWEDWKTALDFLESALAFDPRHAGLLYNRGQALLALGQYAEAEKALKMARDEDVCPLRALTPMYQIVTEVAREQGVPLVDYVGLLQQRMQKLKGYSISGDEYFLDHVHPTIEGHKFLALALIQAMIGQGWVQPGPRWGDQAVAEVTARVEGRIDKRVHGAALANLARVLLWAGKDEDAARLARQALDKAGEYQQVATDSASILISVYQRQGQPEQALQLLYSALEKAPGAMELRLKLGVALADPYFSRYEEAAANLLLVCQQMPESDVAFQFFGKAMVMRGRLDLAYTSLLEAVRLNPKNTNAQQILAKVRRRLGGQAVSLELPNIILSIYPSIAPRKLLQVRFDPAGRQIPDGIEVEFFENGRVKRFQDYQKGLADGLELIWNEKGQLVSQVVYDRGRPLENRPTQN